MILENCEIGDSSYILFVGDDRPHKKLSDLIKVCSSLTTKGLLKGQKLVVLSNRVNPQTHQLIGEMGLEEKVLFLQNMSGESLSAIYSGAIATVIPSAVEGFGLVALEAMACGSPVVSHRLPSIEEICGEVAFYPSPVCNEISGSVESLENALIGLLGDIEQAPVELEKRLEKGIERSKQFAIIDFANKTFSRYLELLMSRGVVTLEELEGLLSGSDSEFESENVKIELRA